ncbi:MAG: PAC2 family protein [Bacteroidetes bacterium]|nr:PAC2 family protein [Bacteroidota bacterium]
MLTVHSQPTLRSPVLLCAVSGWSDAGYAASGALLYLLMKRQAQRIAEFDPDAVFSYTVTRPVTAYDSSGQRTLRWPELAWFALPVPEAAHDLVLLLGPEPDLRWRDTVSAAAGYAVQLGMTQAFTLGAFYAPVHYASPAPVLGLTTDSGLREQLHRLGVRDSDYEGPTGFVTAALHAIIGRGIPAASLWAAAPSYLPNITNPRLSAMLLSVVEKLLGQQLWLAELEAAGRDAERRIAEALKARPELLNLLQQLAGISGQSTEPRREEEQGELPSAEEVLKDLEDYLRRSQGQGPEGQGGGSG